MRINYSKGVSKKKRKMEFGPKLLNPHVDVISNCKYLFSHENLLFDNLKNRPALLQILVNVRMSAFFFPLNRL